MTKPPRKRETHYHKDGSVRAKGWLCDGQLDGPWQWFRKDGTLMRSGTFDMGEQVGDWTTYDARGDVYKVTRIRK
jgi:antitoxin component YwqK of YwqJK toxin-antitoxin module